MNRVSPGQGDGDESTLTNGVNASSFLAGAASNGAARSRASFGNSISYPVAGLGATTLEGVVEANPVTGFMGESLEIKNKQNR